MNEIHFYSALRRRKPRPAAQRINFGRRAKGLKFSVSARTIWPSHRGSSVGCKVGKSPHFIDIELFFDRGIVGIREQDLGQQQQQHDHHRNNAEEREGKVTVDNALVETKYVRGLPPTSSLPSRPRPILFTTTTTRPPPSLQNYNLVRLPPLRNSLHVPVAEVEESLKEQRGEVGEEEEEGRKNVYYSKINFLPPKKNVDSENEVILTPLLELLSFSLLDLSLSYFILSPL